MTLKENTQHEERNQDGNMLGKASHRRAWEEIEKGKLLEDN
jgi:hypothetical protein